MSWMSTWFGWTWLGPTENMLSLGVNPSSSSIIVGGRLMVCRLHAEIFQEISKYYEYMLLLVPSTSGRHWAMVEYHSNSAQTRVNTAQYRDILSISYISTSFKAVCLTFVIKMVTLRLIVPGMSLIFFSNRAPPRCVIERICATATP